jgi:hypothetical protein
MSASVHIHSGSWPRPRLATLLTARNVNRGWRLGDFTGASFEVSRDDGAFSILAERDLLSLLNMVVIEETGLPPWVGFIEKDTWGLKATGVAVQCKEAAQLLQERKTPKQFLVSENTSSAVRRVMVEANAQNPTGIFAATVERGCLATVDLSSVSVADALDSLCEISGQEWWVEPAVSAAKVELTLRVSSARGEDKSGSIVLWEGQLVDAKYVLDAKNIAASLTIVGSGASFATRPAATVSVSGKAESAQQSSESVSVAGQILVANAEQSARLLPWLGPATARDIVSVSPQLSDDATIAGLAVSRLDRGYRGPEEVEAVVSLAVLAGVVVGDTIGLEAESLGPSGISKSFRVQEMAVDDKAGTVTVSGHTEGGLTPRRGLRGLLRGIEASVRDLQRS